MVQARTKQFVRDGSTLHSIGFMVSIRPGDVVETEFKLMVDTIYKWHAQHGDACGEMMIGFVTNPEHEEALMTYMMSLIQ